MCIRDSLPGVLVDVTGARVAGDWGELRGFDRLDRPAAAEGFGMGLSGLPRPDDAHPAKKEERSTGDLASLLGGAATALNACHVAGRVFGVQAGLSVNPRGAVERCHASSDGYGVPDAHLTCMCSALSTVRFPRAEGPRRLALLLRNWLGSPEQLRANRVLVYARGATSEDPFNMLGSIEVATLQVGAALRAPKLERELALPVTLTVGSTGEVQRVHIEGIELLDASKRAAVKRGFERTPFPCPRSGAATEVRLELKIEREPAGGAMQRLFDH